MIALIVLVDRNLIYKITISYIEVVGMHTKQQKLDVQLIGLQLENEEEMIYALLQRMGSKTYYE